MRVCPECRYVTQSEERICPNCGTALSQQNVPEIEEFSIVEQPVQQVIPVEQKPAAEPVFTNAPAPAPVYQSPAPTPAPVAQSQAYYPPASVPVSPKVELPPQYRPLGAWAYFWYGVLFSIPLVGFVFLIVFSFNDANINRRNYARSYWCGLLIAAIIMAVYILLWVVLGASFTAILENAIS